jgi:hypothetical protein
MEMQSPCLRQCDYIVFGGGAGWSVPAMPIICDNSPKIRQCAQLERKQTQRASYDRVLIVSSACMALCSDITSMPSPKG